MIETTQAMRGLRGPLMVAGAALALSGCAATHVGSHWQCPLAQGAQCTSVAAADPAVKRTTGAEAPVRPAPLYRPHRPAGQAVVDGEAARDCAGGCNPFAWLARLFAGDADGAESPSRSGEVAASGMAEGADAADSERATSNGSPPAATVPAAALRAPETIGRVWIAPYVDADGVYREASWVRIVIAPASWKRP